MIRSLHCIVLKVRKTFDRTLKTAQDETKFCKSKSKRAEDSSQKRGRRRQTQIKSTYHLDSLRSGMKTELARSSEEERRVDARALIADEGRDKLRKAMGSRK